MPIRACTATTAALFLLSACKDASSNEATPPSTGTSGASSTASETGVDSDGSTSDDTASPVDTGSSEDTGMGFSVLPDASNPSECDIWEQDCPQGEKCMPWANDGGSSWNATKCAPLDPAPKQPGDACTAQGNDVSGLDDCALGSMCFAVDPETNIGYCVGFCEGSEASPSCPDAGHACNISNNGVLALCLPTCNPLLQDCPSSGWPQGCYPVAGEFLCWPDYSFENGAFGSPCEYFNVCDVGLFCAIPEAVPGCVGSSGCCSEYCDTTETVECSGAAQGQECIPWYQEGEAPPGYETVGFCGIPT